MISPDVLDKIKQNANLPQIVADCGVKLARAGKNYKACCPFHAEDTPSFSVSDGKGAWSYHCYGCGEHGDAIDFLVKHKGLTFRDAAERAAAYAGITIEREKADPKKQAEAEARRRTQKERRAAVMEALAKAQKWFAAQLALEGGKMARDEIARRGWTDQTTADYMLGYAPKEGGIIKALGMPTDILLAAGLIGQRDDKSGYYDRFRHRLIFPIFTPAGCVGFSGRWLGEKDDKRPKYVNTEETEVFHKQNILYGLDQARKAIRETGCVIIEEGHADTVATHNAEIANVVSLQGTAFTAEHRRAISTLGAKAILALDSDKPGIDAALKAVPELLLDQIPVRVVVIPDAKDPDEFLQKFGVASFKRLIDNAPEGFAWWLERKSHNDKATVLKFVTAELVPLLHGLGEAALDMYTDEIKRYLPITIGPLRKMVADYGKDDAPEVNKWAKTQDSGEAEAKIGEIWNDPRGYTCIYRPGADGRPPYPKTIMTGHLEPKKRIRLGDEGEILLADLVCPKRRLRESVKLNTAQWASRRSFKESFPTLDFGYVGTDDELVALKIHLAGQDVPIVRGTRVLGVHKLPQGWAFVGTDKTLLAGGGESTELIHYSDGETGVMYNIGEVSSPTGDDFKTFRSTALGFNAPAKASCILGWMGAVPFKARLHHTTRDSRFPFFNLWGERGSAKSKYQEFLMQFLGAGQVQPTTLNNLKEFSAMLTSSLSNLVPFAIDEYKGSRMDVKHKDVLSNTIRNAYQGLKGTRGRASAQHQRVYPAVAPLVIAGEDSVNEPAAQERMIEVFLSKKNREEEGCRENWEALWRSNLPALGLDFIRWSLDRTDAEIEGTFRRIYDDLAILPKQFKDRIRWNVAVVMFGFAMLERWLADRGHPWPPYTLEAAWDNIQAEQFRARFPSEAGKNKSIVDNILEFMGSAAANSELVYGEDYYVPEDGNLCIYLPKAYPLVKRWAAQTHYDEEFLSQGAFLKQIQQEPYYVDSGKLQRFVSKYSSRVTRCLRLNIKAMEAMGIDADGWQGHMTEHNTRPPAPEEEAKPPQTRLEGV